LKPSFGDRRKKRTCRGLEGREEKIRNDYIRIDFKGRLKGRLVLFNREERSCNIFKGKEENNHTEKSKDQDGRKEGSSNPTIKGEQTRGGRRGKSRKPAGRNTQ